MKLITWFFIIITILCLYVAYDAKSKTSELAEYAQLLENENNVLKSNNFELDGEIIELKSINASKILTIDELTSKLEELKLEINSIINTTITTDTITIVGVADTVIINQEETLYNIYQLNKNYELSGRLKTPSGEYSITINQKPFGLEIREVKTPTGLKRVYARILGRDDLTITDIDFKSTYDEKEKSKIWSIGPGVIVSDNGVSWGVGVNRQRLHLVGTKNSLSATFDILRF